jgi:hypothetical protein
MPATLANLVLSSLLMALGAILHGLTLAPLGGLLERREQRVLLGVTQEVE